MSLGKAEWTCWVLMELPLHAHLPSDKVAFDNRLEGCQPAQPLQYRETLKEEIKFREETIMASNSVHPRQKGLQRAARYSLFQGSLPHVIQVDVFTLGD